MKKSITLLVLILFTITAQSQIYLKGMLQGSQEVPANLSTASGVVIVTYDSMTHVLTLMGNYTGLTADATAAHIHGPATAGVNAPVLIPLTLSGGTSGTLSITDTITDDEAADLMNGLWYVNVHNSPYPGGEIRAQLTTSTSTQSHFFAARLQGAQQVPPNGSMASGNAYILADMGTDSVFLTGSFSGLSSPATAAHIHSPAMPGENAGVAVPLVVTLATSGTIHVASDASSTLITEMMNGMSYVNIHNALYPTGEIRGQILMFTGMYYLKATLQGSQEVPPNGSAGSGTVIVKYNATSNILELTGDYQNLSAQATAAHIHSPAMPGETAPVLIPLNQTGGFSGTLTVTDTITDAEEMDLLNGMMYVNVHTPEFPDGELRGQLTTTSGDAFYFNGNLNGAQQVPFNLSAATGTVTVLLDRASDSVFVTGSFSGLTTPATAGHIHRGEAGVNGPVEVPLNVTAAIDGTINGSGMVSAAFADSMIMGYSYVNIHTTTYPGGEIRAQLGNLVLPVKLLYFNGYKNGNTTTLQWATAEEDHLRSFEIEQQNATSSNWIKKTTVIASGGRNGKTYTVSDVPLAGTNGIALYRLKMIDMDGRFTYSPVISLQFNGSKATLSIVPNPVVNGVLLYTVTGLPADAKANIRVIDFNGRTVSTGVVSTLQNNRLYVGNLPSGLYKLIVNINGTTLQKTFGKQ